MQHFTGVIIFKIHVSLKIKCHKPLNTDNKDIELLTYIMVIPNANHPMIKV